MPSCRYGNPRAPTEVQEDMHILVRLALVTVALLVAALVIWDLSKETRAEALARCERQARSERGVQYVWVEETVAGWTCLFGAGSP